MDEGDIVEEPNQYRLVDVRNEGSLDMISSDRLQPVLALVLDSSWNFQVVQLSFYSQEMQCVKPKWAKLGQFT